MGNVRIERPVKPSNMLKARIKKKGQYKFGKEIILKEGKN